MGKSVHLHPVFSEKHQEYMRRATKATISVAEGSVRAGKTVDNVAAFAFLLSQCPADRIHLATGSTSANAKLNIGDCNGFGLEYIFRGRCHWTKYKGNEALAIKIKNREYIVIFAGGGKADSYKKIRGNSFGMWIATEINLHHEDTIKEAFNRQLAASCRKIFWDLNPGAPEAPIYKNHIDRFEGSFGSAYNYEHFTIRDNAAISPDRIAEIEAQYDPNSVWYKRDILGMRCKAEGVIYDMFNSDIHVLHTEPETEGDYFVSSDYGIQNATTFLLWRKIKGKYAFVCLREYYYSGRDERKQKTVSEHVTGLKEMLNGIMPKVIIVDPSAAALIVELRKEGFKVQPADNEVLSGISDVGNMLRNEELFFMDCCKNTIGEFGIYSWDTKAAEQGEDKPVKESDHGMDAVRYMVKTRRLNRKAKESRNEGLILL